MKLIVNYPFNQEDRETLMGLLTAGPAIAPVLPLASPVPPVINPELSGSWSPETGYVAGIPTPPLTVVPTVPTAPVVAAIPTPPAGVTVDSEGLPWDKRIHASTKTRRQSDDTWKLIKGVDPALVEKVKAELRQAMSAAPVVPVVPAAPVVPVVPAAPTITYEGLMTWIDNKYAARELTGSQVLQHVKSVYGMESVVELRNLPSEALASVQKFLASICIPFEAPTAPTVPTTAAVETAPTTTVPQPPNATAVAPPPASTDFWAPPTPPAAADPNCPTTYAEMCDWMVQHVTGGKFAKTDVQEAFNANGLPTVPSLEHRPDLIPAIYAKLAALVQP